MNNPFNLTPRQKLTRARVLLNRSHPFFARLTMLMKFVEMPEIQTMAVDAKGICYYSPDFVDSLSDDELMGTLCHEVMHCVLEHLERGEGKDSFIFNVAADLVNNEMITANGLKLPKGGLIPYNHKYTLKLPDGSNLVIEDINKRGAEGIYTQIKNAWKNQNGQGQGNGSGDSSQQGFDKHIYGKGNGQDKDVAGRDSDFWKNKVVEADMASKMAGKSPLGMDRIIDSITNPKMSWKQLLQRYVRANLPFDYTWKRPNKKTYSSGIYLPNVEKQGIHIVFLIDTSGSMSEKELKEAFGEIMGIVKTIHGVTLHVIYHDTDVYEGSSLLNPTAQDIMKELKNCKGGGGTDFTTAYKYLEEKVKDADVFIHFTDGYDRFPKKFNKPIIICLQSSGKNIDAVKSEVHYGKVIKVDG
jgi:predicted metal-dependent peptidase